jgi:hypothetical protein
MSNQQGALNKLLSGNFSGAWGDVETSVEDFFDDDIAPALKDWLAQFGTDFGSAALSAAGTLAGNVITGTTTITAAAGQIVSQLGSIALQAGENATQTALNALRVQITSASPNASSSASAPTNQATPS